LVDDESMPTLVFKVWEKERSTGHYELARNDRDGCADDTPPDCVEIAAKPAEYGTVTRRCKYSSPLANLSVRISQKRSAVSGVGHQHDIDL
jgi:hypothetical protein